jgi:predicted GNAT family acetyltransferase
MKVCRHAHPQSFLERAGAFLLRSEVENGLILGIARQLLEDDSRYDKPIYLATLEDNDTVIGCAFRTAPYQLGLSAMPAPAIALLAADIGEIYPALPAVSGPVPVARQFADAWTAQTGGRWSVRFQLRIHVLEQSVGFPDPPIPGALRRADTADIALADQWAVNFVRDAGIKIEARQAGERLIRQQRLYFWDHDRPRSMLAVVRETPHGACIGYVYTPAVWRGRGYASSAVASLSRLALDQGRQFCFLYTDLANPTANAIYHRIGYRPVSDTVEIDFF